MDIQQCRFGCLIVQRTLLCGNSSIGLTVITTVEIGTCTATLEMTLIRTFLLLTLAMYIFLKQCQDQS